MLHLPKEVKALLDMYLLIRNRKFADVKSPLYKRDNWLQDFKTKFFLKSSTSPFGSVDLKSVSELVGCKLNPQLIRQFVTTWGKSHLSELIRDSENSALQHSDRVLHHYQLNKQLRPQTFVQQLVVEENLLPPRVGELIDTARKSVETLLDQQEDKSSKKRKEYLIDQKEEDKKRKALMTPLGRNRRIRAKTRDSFKEILQKDFGQDMDVPIFVKGMKPARWKKFIIRKVHDPYHEDGKQIRELWRDINAGDFKFGIRDSRWEALKKGVKFTCKSRNAFIARGLKTSIENMQKSRI